MIIILKLSKTIKDEHEVHLARLEIESITGETPDPIPNLADELFEHPLASFMGAVSEKPFIESHRFQDYFLHEPPYGSTQGFKIEIEDESAAERLQKRLAYTSEIYIVCDGIKPFSVKDEMIGVDRQVFSNGSKKVIRLIAHQFYFETSEYILKISKSLPISELERFFNRIVDSKFTLLKRIPASAGARVGKRLLDYVAERREPSLYLTHSLYPYKGRFHPRLAKALVNIVHPEDTGIIIDCFAGSGTSLIEANIVGLQAVGIDINPIAKEVAQTKTDLLTTTIDLMNSFCASYEKLVQDTGIVANNQSEVESSIPKQDSEKYSDLSYIGDKIRDAPRHVQGYLKLALTMAISLQRKKRKKIDAPTLFKEKCYHIHRVGVLSVLLARKLGVKYGKSVIVRGDASDTVLFRKLGPMRAGVNSPPYSTAIDYIGNDLVQMQLLGHIKSSEELLLLDEKLAGNPRRKYQESIDLDSIPTAYGRKAIEVLTQCGRKQDAASYANFIIFLDRSLKAQTSNLVVGSKLAIVIGNNHLKIDDKHIGSRDYVSDMHIVDDANFEESSKSQLLLGSDVLNCLDDTRLHATSNSKGRSKSNRGVFLEIESDRALIEIGQRYDLHPRLYLKRRLEKSLRGNIRYESIILFGKGIPDTCLVDSTDLQVTEEYGLNNPDVVLE